MNPSILFYIIIGIIVFDFVLERVLEWLNHTWRDKPIPKLLSDVYDKDKYEKQQHYSTVSGNFSLLTASFSFVIMLLFLFFNGFAFLNNYLSASIESELWLGMAFFGVLFFGLDLIGIPFSLYSTFVIEERFGFNKSTIKTFVLDKLKSYLLTTLIGGGLYVVVFKLYEKTQDNFWIYCWVILSAFMLLFSMFYSNIIVPLFNKQTPLPDGELKAAINDFSEKVGFKLKNIYEINGSKRSTRANAYFTGLGPQKRIVLYDTLINDLETKELVAVLAHEIGHYKKKHTVQGLFLSIIQMGIMFFVLSIFISNPALSKALGVNEQLFHISLIVFSLLYSPISTVTGLLMNMLSRKNEYQADRYAADNYDAKSLESGLKKLARNNLSNLTPHPWYTFVNYSHPDLNNRLMMLLKVNK